jgi:hypothetical protein
MRPALLTLVLVGLGACAKNGDQGFVILQNATTVPGSTICMLTADVTGPTISQGVIYSGSPSGYLASPIFESRITANAGQELQRSIYLQGAHISLSVPAGGGSVNFGPNPHDAYFSGELAPNGGTAVVSFELIPAAAVQSVGTGSATVLATVTAFGTLGGDRIDAEPWLFSVQICSNCVVVDHGACPMTVQMVRNGNACNVFQDGIVDCCEDTGGLLCPGRTM